MRMPAGLVRREVLTVQSDRLSPDRGQYAFAQALLRQVAYDMLGKRERRARHIAAAEQSDIDAGPYYAVVSGVCSEGPETSDTANFSFGTPVSAPSSRRQNG